MMSNPRLHYADCLSPLGSHRMAYHEWGASDNPNVLLCVHGLTRTGRDFDEVAQRLASQYRVICPDVVGRGQSDWLSEGSFYAVPQYVSDIMTLLTSLALPKVDWFGTSMGGLIGMAIAALPNSPIQRLLLNDIGPRVDINGLQRISQYVGLSTDFASFGEAVLYIKKVAASFGPHTDEQWAKLTEHVVKILPNGHWSLSYDPKISAGFRGLSAEALQATEAALWMTYELIRCPTLVVRGAESDLLSADTVQMMTQRGPRAKCVEVSGVGHAPTFLAEDQIQIAVDFFNPTN